LEDRQISVKSIAEQLGISRERVGSITHEDLDMLVACFLPGRAKELSTPLYMKLSRSILLRTRNVSEKKAGTENQNTRSVIFFNPAVYEVIWKNVVQPYEPQTTI
jgi:hypothetical protein